MWNWIFLLSFVTTLTYKVSGQQISLDSVDKNQIISIMKEQESAWNLGMIDEFMDGYWKSDSLQFIGKSGLTRGWDATLAGYKKSYPGKEGMGNLRFEIISVEKAGSNYAMVIGKYRLTSNARDDKGIFSLLWKKMNGHWKIVLDHTSAM